MHSLREVEYAASGCVLCMSCSKPGNVPLVDGRTQVVFGSGSQRALLMFIGEAPGKDEDLAGEPFAGKGLNQAGAILDQRLEAIGLLRPEIYVSNVVKCRPTKVGKGDSPKNRAPEEGEIRACRPWIEEEVMFVQPQLVVPLGVPAAEYVLGDRVLMKDVHGQVLQGEGSTWSGRKIVPTYHPAGIRGSEELRQMFADDFETIRRVYKDIVAGLASSG